MSDYHECSVQCETECAHEVAAALRAENARLREALEKYGKHLEHCDVDDLFIPKPCNCGLTAALQETRHE